VPRRRNRQESGITAEINVTSLVDVALTLLVIFIITAPMMQGGVEITMPKARTQSVPTSEGLTVTVDKAGQVFIGQAAVRLDEFERQFPEMVKEKGASSVYLRADDGVPYGKVIQVLGLMKAADVASVGLIAEPEPEKR
jgi:biopolymer transport protein ExbD/biopolymer transport protein TolR